MKTVQLIVDLQFEPIIQPGHGTYLHHMVLYECHVNDGDSSDDWFERHVSSEGSACYSPNMPQEWSFCLATNAWAWVRFQLVIEVCVLCLVQVAREPDFSSDYLSSNLVEF